MGTWKTVKGRRGSWQLHDLSSDIGETKDLAAARPQIVKRIDRLASKAYVKPRPIVGSMRTGIRDYVRGDRIGKKNAR